MELKNIICYCAHKTIYVSCLSYHIAENKIGGSLHHSKCEDAGGANFIEIVDHVEGIIFCGCGADSSAEKRMPLIDGGH